MSIQIVDIAIFSHDQRTRVLSLKPGLVNIITGASKTGKSALIDIVDYCLGAEDCRVPEGPIRRAVSWFGLRLQLHGGQAFIARRCPDHNVASSEDCFVELATQVAIPQPASLRQTTNTEGLVDLLNAWTGIIDNTHEPLPGQSRLPVAATVRHALFLCFQPQDEIIRRDQLFHRTSNGYLAQALRDTLPYFLGAVDDDNVRKREELRRLKEQLRKHERELREITAIAGEGVSKAQALLAQAREAGLTATIASTWEESIAALGEIDRTPGIAIDPATPIGEEFTRLAEERDALIDRQRRLSEEISAARGFERDEGRFSAEASEQAGRLVSIGMFEVPTSPTACPFCGQDIPDEGALPTAAEVRSTLEDVSARLEAVDRNAPQVEKAIARLELDLAGVQSALAENRVAMDAVRSASDRIQELRDDASKRALIVGRVSLYLESLPDLPGTKALETQIAEIRNQCDLLEQELSSETIQERVDSISSILSSWMTDWAVRLDLEHAGFPLRIDLRRLTMVTDTERGPLPMDRMGSGENWVGHHLIAHLGLHKWFTEQGRPVPRFLFLDQPSQVYFPTEEDTDGSVASLGENDREAVSRMFRFVFERVQELTPGLQVIVTEHADIAEDWYRDAVAERWRGGLKLVPDDWPDLQSDDGASDEDDGEGEQSL